MEKTKSFEDIAAVLFDLDGVLVDTEGIYTDFWAEIDRQYPTGVENFALKIKGNTLHAIFSNWFPDAAVQSRIKEILAEHERNMRYMLFPGVDMLLKKLHENSVKTAIVTSSNPTKMRNLFTQVPQLEKLIDTVVTDADITHGKPDPEGYLLAAHRLGTDIKQCAVIEDSLAGLEAGRRSGAKTIAIATTNPVDALQGNADIVLHNIEELVNCLLSTQPHGCAI